MDNQSLYLEAWRESAEAIAALVPTLDDDQLAAPTDCPGWSVADVVAHLAHLEQVINGEPEAPSDLGIVASDYTEAGVAARRGTPTADLIGQFAGDVAERYARLSTTTLDMGELAPVTPAGVAWTWETMLRNRVVDVWTHEQDIRRAVDVPGNLDSPAAHVTTHTFAAGMGFVLGKKVRSDPGTTVQWDLDGGVPLVVTLQVDENGRAGRVDADTPTTVTLRMSAETFTILAAGRRTREQVDVQIDGDAALGSTLLGAMTLTF